MVRKWVDNKSQNEYNNLVMITIVIINIGGAYEKGFLFFCA